MWGDTYTLALDSGFTLTAVPGRNSSATETLTPLMTASSGNSTGA